MCHPPVVIIIEVIMDTEKHIPVGTQIPFIFLGGPTNQGIIGIIQGSWYPEVSVSVITVMGVTVKYPLRDIGMIGRKKAVNLEFYCDAYWIRSFRYLHPIHIVDQWVLCLTRSDTK